MKTRLLIIIGIIFIVSVLLYVFVLGAIGQCDLPLTFCTNFIKSNFVGGGSTNLDPELSPTYALDFMGGLFYHTILPLTALSTVISALFLVPYFILKRKNIPSKPYLSLIVAGLLLYFGTPYLISSLEAFAMIFSSQPEQIIRWIVDIRFVLSLIPFIVLSIAGILLYRSSILRKLIRK
ncbi:hypothetical protein [Nitrosopumilus adriaticus]|uniref:hypothetical protein n=1 Tax=Nitrosopumilus adriaticus TaxID=1580092 RepID=UPI00352DC392